MSTTATTTGPHYELEQDPTSGVLRVRLSGTWTVERGRPAPKELIPLMRSLPRDSRIILEDAGIGHWDSLLVAFVRTTFLIAADGGVSVDASTLPEGARKLIDLAAAVPPKGDDRSPEDDALTARVGRLALGAWDTASDATEFLGEVVEAFVAFLRGRARFRRVDLMHAVESAGVGALGIVALINFLIGAVLAFVGAVQLEQFGAAIYVANLVAIGVARELGALMTGIVMAGRTGASFAAVLGTMKVNEEVDALETMGLRPVEFLVLPRVLATALMMPALVAYADLMGILGGHVRRGDPPRPRRHAVPARRRRARWTLRHVLIGLVEGLVFGGGGRADRLLLRHALRPQRRRGRAGDHQRGGDRASCSWSSWPRSSPCVLHLLGL